MAVAEHTSGLAREIRNAVASEQFDLAGYTEVRIRDLVNAAFTTPLTAPKSMIRFTFVVGGGKLVRSRYDEDMVKWFTGALRDIGYIEDKSAAETLDSQGTFKHQHDTGQNLKYVIVFPKVVISEETSVSDTSTVDMSSPEYIVVACELDTFRDIVAVKTPSWRQKKKLLKILQDSYEEFQKIEQKLVNGQPLSPTEQTIYDSNPGNTMEKITYLQHEIKTMVDSGKLTASEKEELLHTLTANISALVAESNTASEPKKNKIEERKRSVEERKAAIEKITPIRHRLKHGPEIQPLRVKLIPLLALEDKSRSVSLTLADLKSLEMKSELEASILQLENASRTWFEDEADFKVMCDYETSLAKASASKKSSSGPVSKTTNSSTKSSSAGSAWSTVGVTKKTSNSNTSTVKKSGGGFAAAFDDDSD